MTFPARVLSGLDTPPYRATTAWLQLTVMVLGALGDHLPRTTSSAPRAVSLPASAASGHAAVGWSAIVNGARLLLATLR